MTKEQELINDFAQKVWEAIDSNEYLYDLLPGNGEDDHILDTIRKIIGRVELEYKKSAK